LFRENSAGTLGLQLLWVAADITDAAAGGKAA
jgi:hypothetical protein